MSTHPTPTEITSVINAIPATMKDAETKLVHVISEGMTNLRDITMCQTTWESKAKTVSDDAYRQHRCGVLKGMEHSVHVCRYCGAS